MRFSDTLITIASLSAATQAEEPMALDDSCANDLDDSCCDEFWCNNESMEETKQNAVEDDENGSGKPGGQPCEANNECESDLCNWNVSPYSCSFPTKENEECLAIDDGCANDPEGCCDGSWCNRWSMVCE